MDLIDIGDEIASRLLQWQDQQGRRRNITIRLGKPRSFDGSEDMYCPLQIEGLGSGRPKYAAGVDGVQAILLAVKMLAVDLRSLEEEFGGTITWMSQRSWELL